jgi:hypothetical protein
MSVSASKTLVDALQESFIGALRSPDGTATPAALLWTDANGQWRPLLPTLTKAIPELYALGSFAPEERQGPVIWLKCVVERTLPYGSPAPDVAHEPISLPMPLGYEMQWRVPEWKFLTRINRR